MKTWLADGHRLTLAAEPPPYGARLDIGFLDFHRALEVRLTPEEARALGAALLALADAVREGEAVTP